MIAAFHNAFGYLIRVIFHVAMGLFLTRILLQAVRADFYNPISQMVWRATQAIATPLQRVLPRFQGRFDMACVLLLCVLAYAYIEAMNFVYGAPSCSPAGSSYCDIGFPVQSAALKIIWMILYMYTLFMFVQAILSWVGPGVSNPAANILWSINEPILRPIRRLIPSSSGLDFSPLIAMVAVQFLAILLPLDGIY